MHLDDLDFDMEQIRYDIREQEKQIRRKEEERKSILEQLALTDYDAIKDRLDACVAWLGSYQEKFSNCLKA